MEMFEQLTLNIEDGSPIKLLCKLHKSKTPITSKVVLDSKVKEVAKNFDYDFNGESQFYPYEFPKILNEIDYNILCIVGASGSGKSTFSKNFGVCVCVCWDNAKSIVSNFEENGIEKLCAVGLNSIPTWCKPRNVLSVGEGFRADLARQIGDNCVIDEFTSTIDRNVAKSCSNAIGKYIRKKNIKKCVFVSCHKDFIDYLQPDIVVDLDRECVYDTRGLVRQQIELSIYETNDKREVWEIFRKHHYLSSELNIACKMYVAFWGKELVGMIAIIPHPGMVQNAYRIHRLVILPDYQGLGIGKKLLEQMTYLYASKGATMYIRTSHIKLANALLNSKEWVETQRSGTQSPQYGVLWEVINDRIAYSFKYVGDSKSDLVDNELNFQKKIKVKTISLFD